MKERPSQIERGSMEIIRAELAARNVSVEPEEEAVLLRCIHASADFDYAENLRFTAGAVRRATAALQNAAHIVTDTNMALAGLSKPGLQKLGGEGHCFMAEPEIALLARQRNSTRAAAAVDYAAARFPGAVYAVGNAPTALFALADQLERGLRPALIVAVPVGFVNVVESKEKILALCTALEVPCIAAMGRKGGSSIAAAVCNALIYTAAGLLDPAARGWS